MGMAGWAAAGGVALIAWGVSEFMSVPAEMFDNESRSWRDDKEEDGSSSISSPAERVAMAGWAASAGMALLAWGVSEFIFSLKENSPPVAAMRSSDDDQCMDESESEIAAINPSTSEVPRSDVVPRWERPSRGSYKLNFDGSDRHQLNLAGAGCIIRDHRGFPVAAAAYMVNRENVSFAEAEALRKGLELANRLKIHALCIEGDSKEIIDRIQGSIPFNGRSPTRMDDLIKEIKQEIERWGWETKHVSRDANRVADALAHMAARFQPCDQPMQIWHDDVARSLPPHIASLVEADRVGSSSH